MSQVTEDLTEIGISSINSYAQGVKQLFKNSNISHVRMFLCNFFLTPLKQKQDLMKAAKGFASHEANIENTQHVCIILSNI